MSGRSQAAALSLALLAAAWSGCASRPKTGLVIGVVTQAEVPKELRTVRVLAEVNGRPAACTVYALSNPNVHLPVTVALDPGSERPEAIDVIVTGYSEDFAGVSCADLGNRPPRIVRHVRTSYVPEQMLYLPMPLTQACLDVACTSGETCRGGVCGDPTVDSKDLVEYSDPLAIGDTTFCFSPKLCFDTQAPLLLVDRETCTFEVPKEIPLDKGGFNVRAVFDNLEQEALDNDPNEGFLLDPKKPTQLQLAPNLCKTRFLPQKILAVTVGVGCPPKSPLQPVCSDELKVLQDGDPSRAALCADVALPPTRSALYVLFDTSKGMSKFFGPDGLALTIERTLRAPVLGTTLVGLRPLPASASECTAAPGKFATPAVPFAPADAAATVIGAFLRDRSQVRADDPPLFLDAVTRNEAAYKALLDLPNDGKGPFNARGLAIVGNRDFQAHCSPEVGSPSSSAFGVSQATGVHTHVLLLKAEGEVPFSDGNAFIDGIALTRSGGGGFVDASFDPTQIGPGLAGLAAVLGSCLYDVDPAVDITKDPSRSKVSYFDVLKQGRVDIGFNARCADKSSDDGWNAEQGKVRVCGKPCDDLRFLLQTSIFASVDREKLPPDIPMRLARPCK